MARTSFIFSLFAATCLSLEANNPTWGASTESTPRVAVEGGAGWIQGQEGYRIGGDVTLADGREGRLHFPISELLFSYQGPVGFLQGMLEIPSVFRVVGTFQGSLADGTGEVEDRDWIFSSRRVDIESRSDNETSLWMAEVRLEVPLNQPPPFVCSIRGGYRYESYDHRVTNLRQWYPSRPDLKEERADGLVATYATRYHIPYGGVGLEWALPEVGGQSFGVTICGHVDGAIVMMTDEDFHLLRDKISESLNVGFGISAGGQIRLVFLERLAAGVGGSFWLARTTGRQTQYAVHKGERWLIGELDSENEHERWTLFGWVGILF